MTKGTVKFFNESKGYGFVIEEGSGREIFVHTSALKSPIREKDQVEFEVQQGKKGLTAVNVKVIK